MREKVKVLVEHKKFQNFIVALIILNGITLGMETSKYLKEHIGGFLYYFDLFALTIFTIEILLKIYAFGVRFFRDYWNLFDFFVILIALIPATGPLSVLRALRILRLFRLLTVVPQMRLIVTALLSVIPSMSSVVMIMLIMFYVFAVICTNLYAETFPEWFGTIGESLYTLFQIMTLESWSMGIVRPLMEKHPQAYLIFIPFILLATFIMINLIVAVIVDAMNSIRQNIQDNEIKEIEEHEKRHYEILLQEIKELKEEIKRLNSRIKR